MYVTVIDEGYKHEGAVYVFSSILSARACVWWYIRRIDDTRDDYDTVDAKLYRVRKNGKCKLIDEFSDVALKDGFAEEWKSEGRREAEHQQWEVEREAERQWRAEYVVEPIESHAD
jgi:hypothetical protein